MFERLVVAINGHEDNIRIQSNRGCVCVRVCVRVSCCYYPTKANFEISGNLIEVVVALSTRRKAGENVR